MINYLQERLRGESSNGERSFRGKPFGVELIFQPPYSPELNSREFCFRSVKAYFRQ